MRLRPDDVAMVIGIVVVVLMAALAMRAGAAGWWQADGCGEWTAMVQRIEAMTPEQRRAVPDVIPAGHARQRAMALSAIHYVEEGGTAADAVALCQSIEREEAT